MNRRLLEAAAVVVLLIGAIWAASAWGEARHKDKAQAFEVQAAQAEGQAKAAMSAAQESDKRAAVSEAAKQSADVQATTAKRELAALRASLTHKPPFISNTVGSTPAVPGAEGGAIPATAVEGVPQLQAIIEKQDEVIQAQDGQIHARDLVIADLTVSRDQWKATAGHLQDQADAQALATAEWRKAVGAGERRAGIKWGVAGLAVGFLVGRR